MSGEPIDSINEFFYSLKTYSFIVADAIDKQADTLAGTIRDTLSKSEWIPESARPSPRRVPVPERMFNAVGGVGRRGGWWDKNKWSVAIVVVAAALGVAGYGYAKRKKDRKKRRAKKAGNGGRREVVVIAGRSPHDPISRSLALDLERRGFIVYVVVNSIEDEHVVANEGRSDIKPLNIDILDTENAQTAVEKFTIYLSNPVQAFPGAHPHNLNLAGVILIPDLTYPTGPVETTPIDLWSDTLNLKILSTVVTAKSFLRVLCDFHSRLLLLTPNVISPLSPPFHAPETVAVAALSGLATSLRRELAPLGVDVCHFKLGTFDCSAMMARQQQDRVNATRAEILSWAVPARVAYAKNYMSLSSKSGNSGPAGIKGSSLRELHLAVFDALTDEKPSTVWRVGSGSMIYEVLGKIVPDGLVSWMLGASRKGENGERREEGMIMGLGGVGSASGSAGTSEGSVEWEKL
ncbi:DUF1776-domain-containing protein [Choiromyces venosus 120613-1]|uniref:DUF1776-domain-containing protein n=1 Tax=Choiromyces venosus 120613-1 TaxID=1336337 RepID=A0A3N4JRB9_9PEZI|nr:DUF1776-domain-containing protein [Choiromyces venosus 120613-1]